MNMIDFQEILNLVSFEPAIDTHTRAMPNKQIRPTTSVHRFMWPVSRIPSFQYLQNDEGGTHNDLNIFMIPSSEILVVYLRCSKHCVCQGLQSSTKSQLLTPA